MMVAEIGVDVTGIVRATEFIITMLHNSKKSTIKSLTDFVFEQICSLYWMAIMFHKI